VRKYRELGVPLDGVILDWRYWGNNYLWNAMEFLDPEFPDPKGMIQEIHNMKARIMISVWNSFGPMTKQYRELKEIGALLDFITWPESGCDLWPPRHDYPSGVRVYDAYNPQARDIYWRYLKQGLFSLGIDGWWIDSSEPDHLQFKDSDLDNRTYLGSFRRVRNAYPLMTVGGLYTHQRADTAERRVLILTRSAFTGQQRYGSIVWSGDVVASWDTLRKQIPAALNFSLCGMPFWNSDIGGFFLWNFREKLRDVEYRELYVRWLQFATFCAMMRSHGTDAPREIYQFGNRGDPEYDAIERFIKLRYLLLPYIYSVAWDVTANHSTMMRALVMDFPHDPRAIRVQDQFMFGKAILVCPVTERMYSVGGRLDLSNAKRRKVYLPDGSRWYDFWTGEVHDGGSFVERECPLDMIPLYVRAGSIIPIGPRVQYSTEKKWDELEIRVFGGANGRFVLYEDELDGYNYENGAYSTIAFEWDDATGTLTIQDRTGAFPGMLQERTFKVVLVEKDKGVGDTHSPVCDKAVVFTGNKTTVKLR
jgi:alpha-D-xyloside xylohydrolase